MRRLWRAAHRVAGGGEVFDRRDHTCRYIEAHGIAGAAFGAGIIRHQDSDFTFAAPQSAQANERGDAIRHHGHAIGLRPACQRGECQTRLRRQRILECDGSGKDTAVELGKDYMHGEIGGAESARAGAPGGPLGGGADDLQHRHPCFVEHGLFVGAGAGGEGGGGDNQRRIELCEGSAQERRGIVVL